ncbi:type I polyketide synthase [Achromobacter sp. Marseille-Q4962]|uniref:type I polyketide synthase n=1 Tax=Achromobacter sp. Marseille-Q4962 TaxID=2942202 RepID=UPI0020732A9D|nr:type I polyketide synthase [Achromobacter sp. Marseille-Q4962]
MAKRVALIGLSFRFPGTDTQNYWPDLLQGRDLVTEVHPSRWSADAYRHPLREHPGTAYTHAAGSLGDISGFDAAFFGISPREASLMDPQQRLLLELAWETMERAGVRPSRLRGSDCGVYIGIASADYSYRMSEDLGVIDTSFATGNTNSIAANRLSYVFDLRGPSMSVDTACSSSLVAFHQACRAIESGEISQALAGGVSLHLHPYGFLIFSKASMLSRRGRCNVFDAAGDGYVRSEGGGLFLLKDYDRALADGDRILAVVAGTAVNTDGRKAGLTVPSADAQAALLSQAYARAGIDPADIDYLEAHGTGTPVGDPIETRAIGDALGARRPAGRPLPIGSVKSNMGHLEAASGVAGLVKAVYALLHREVPATIGIRELNPAIRTREWNLDIVTSNRPLRNEGQLTVGVNSFGFGGANAHVILQSAADTASSAPAADAGGRELPVVVSGRSPQALRDAARAMAEHLRRQDDAGFYDAACEAALRRDWHEHRALAWSRSPAEAADALHAVAQGKPHPLAHAAQAAGPQAGAVFVYSGNGSQWAGMGARLMADPDFARAVRDIDEIYAPLAGWRVADDLADTGNAGRYARTERAQPALFAIQVGLTRMLAARGIRPAAVAGHSVGEVAAAWACGALTLADAVRVIHHRSRLQGGTRGSGRMMAVNIDGASAQALLAELGLASRLCVAGYNSARGATLAGEAAALDELEPALRERGIAGRRLDLDYAFHSPAMDGLRPELAASLADLAPQATHCAFYSTVTGGELAAGALNADYWWRNVRLPVKFEQAAAQAVQAGHGLFVEIGPHPVLRGYLSEAVKDRGDGRVLATLSRGEDDPSRVRAVAAQILLAGAEPDWRAYFPAPGRPHVLPAYPWQRERHWHPDTPQTQGLLQRHAVHPLLGWRLAQHECAWESRIDTHTHPQLADHRVGEAAVFPGAAYAETAWAAALQRQPSGFVEIENLEIHAPLLLGPSPSRLLRTHIEAEDGRLLIRARPTGEDAPWTVHASARILAEPGDALLRAPLASPPGRDADFDAARHAALTRAVGLDYGPAYQRVERGWRLDERTVLAELRESAQESWPGHLDPAELDAAFQLAVHLFADQAQAEPAWPGHAWPGHAWPGLAWPGLAYVPARIDRAALRVDAGPARYAVLRLRRRSAHALTVDIRLHDADGAPIAALRETSLRSVRLLQAGADRLDFLGVALTPRPRARTGDASLLADLRATLEEAFEAAARDPRYARYAGEAEPLLDALCDRYGLEALRALAGEDGWIADSALSRCRAQAPDMAPLLDGMLARAEAAGDLQRDGQGWRARAASGDEAASADIWNTLAREYPEHAGPALAAGRVGLRLAALLQGVAEPDSAECPGFGPQDLGSHLWDAPARHELARALRRCLRRAQSSLAPGRRLRILECGAGAPPLGPELCEELDFRVADYRCAAGDEAGVQAARARLADYPDAQILLLGDEQAGAGQAVDLAIVHCDFASLEQARAALREARTLLAPGGTLLLAAHHPAAWADMVFGIRPSWWTDAADGGKLPAQQGSDFWRRELQALGCACGPLLQAVPGSPSGPYLLQAQAGDPADADPADDASPESRRWLVLSDAKGASAGLAQKLTRELRARGQDVTHCRLDADADSDTLPAIAQSGPYDHVVHACGLYAPAADAQQAWSVQTRRCALAAAAWRAIEAQQTPAVLWLLTAHSGLQADAALSGYGRSLANESSAHAVRLLDLPPQAAAAPMKALLAELLAPDAEQEAALAADGSRLAPRLQPVPRPAVSCLGQEGGARRLAFDLPGQLRNLRWTVQPPRPPADDELEIQVHATGLNFRDVMYALGLLADEALEQGYAGPTLGLEFAGTVLRAGAAVSGYAPGDAVLGFGPASFSDRVCVGTTAVAPLPPGMSFEAAATIPSAFFTVYYALHHLARLEPGESILIHGAAGGVGLAAVQYAQWRGAEVHATAGTPAKRDFLRLMGVSHVYDSRSLGYADEIRERTGGRGVDVVLNSLAGEAVRRSLDAMAPFGRFIELGKRDFYENTRIGLRPMRNNLSYFGVDADQLLRARPGLARRLYGEMMELFREGALRPLPHCVFEARDVVDAFRHMQQARQIGKIVVTYRRGLPPPAQTSAGVPLRLRADGCYLVSGGLSGFGLRTAQWLADKGARRLALVGRSGPASDEARQAVQALRDQGVRVWAEACDVADRAALSSLLDRLRGEAGPLCGVVHAAAVIEDGLARNASADAIARVLAPKMLGAGLLDELTREQPLELFVLFSSATTLFGNPGQSAYVAANAWMEALARRRLEQGLPATCVGWGPIADAGYLARNADVRDALSRRMGAAPLAAESALAALEDMLLARASGLGVMTLDWPALARHLPAAAAPRYAALAARGGGAQSAAQEAGGLLEELASLDDDALAARIVEVLRHEVGEILRTPPDKIDPSRSLYDIGLDSLMGVELVVALEARFGIRLPVMALSESPTLEKLAARLMRALRGEESGEADELDAHIARLASQHAAEVSPGERVAIEQRLRAASSGTGVAS